MITAQPAAPASSVAQFRIPPRARRASLVGAGIVVAILLGVFFRFYHIDRKVYWEDETYTSLHVLGQTEADVVRRAAQFADAAALRAVLHPPRPLTTTVGDTVRSLAVEDPQHPPLYYVAGHVWVKLFGDSVAAIRTLSAILGVIALPCMYWLCMELFGSIAAAWIGVALFAISPIAVLFSQEAREYMLWSLAVVVMSAAFLRALRLGSKPAWALYAAALAASLYIFPLSATLALGNLVVAAATRRDASRTPGAPAVATLAGFVAFAPWLAVMCGNLEKIRRTMGFAPAFSASPLDVVRRFLGLLKLNFLDFNVVGHALGAGLTLAVATLVGYAFIYLARRAPHRTWIFIVTLTAFAALPYIVADLLLGGRFTGSPRYFMPLYLSIDLTLVYLFASTVRPTNLRRVRRRAWAFLLVGVIAGRVASCAASAGADTWWTKFQEQSIEVAGAINQSDRPLLLSSEYVERPLSISNYLKPGVALQLRPKCSLCSTGAAGEFDLTDIQRSSAYGAVFVLGPTTAIEQEVKAAIVQSRRGERYRCIADQPGAAGNCAADSLHLWPS